jgi:trehalose 6-phosphate synthase
MPADRPHLVLASNRGPVSFKRDSAGGLVASRGAGGLVSSISPLIAGTGATWVAAAMSDEDREAAGREGALEAEGFRLRLLDIDPLQYSQAYNVVSNATLWFVHHGLYDLPRRPRFDRRWREAWEGYRAYNARFAEALADAAPDGAVTLVQDYHLSLVPKLLADKRPDLSIVHFSHTPFAEPSLLRVLPTADELLEGMAGATACGFHARRWAANFEACCRDVLGASPPVFTSPIAPDPNDIGAVADTDDCAAEDEWIDQALGGGRGDRRMILRVDRIELSKNIVRGFLAFDELLSERPEWREQVTFAAFVYPSRQTLPDYLGYQAEVETLVRRLNAKWATPSWTPIVLDATDDFPASVAGLRRYDVLLVNPVRDGLNLVAKEGPVVNERDGVVVLSREAGAWDELGQWTLGVNPFDVSATAEAMHTALTMDAASRRSRAEALRSAAQQRGPQEWLADLLSAADVF